MGRLVRNRLGGQEILDEPARIGIEKLLNPLLACRFKNETRVMNLVYAIDDFVFVIGRSVGTLLARERENHTSVIAPYRGQLIGLSAGSDFEPRPLAPQIDAGGRL